MPVHVLRRLGAIDDINGGRDSFRHADQGTRRGSVVRRGRDCVSGRNIDLRALYIQSDIGRAIRGAAATPMLCRQKACYGHAGDKCATRKRHAAGRSLIVLFDSLILSHLTLLGRQYLKP